MAETVKSALFVDYDSFIRSLNVEDIDVAERFAERATAWVTAIEKGKLVSPQDKDGIRRRALVRRCYADPKLLGSNRPAMIAAGFEVIDCEAADGRDRNAAEVAMVLDVVDALQHPAEYNEFILLAADSDLKPLLVRLRAHNRETVIYANEVTGPSYKALADGMIEEEPLVALLSGKAEPKKVADTPAEPRPPVVKDRTAIEALARRVHAATNVPMFSPRTFADLFRCLAEEIAEHGYHFQKTAENVTERLLAAGRNVNRRQVLFVVKGLALKGHVFSVTDTPSRLAEVFREQVAYLAENAGVELTDDDRALIPAWIVGRAAAPPKPAAPAEKPVKSAARKTPARRTAKPKTVAKKPEPEPEPDEVAVEAIVEDLEEPVEPAEEKPAPKRKAPLSDSPAMKRLADARARAAKRRAAKDADTPEEEERPAPKKAAAAPRKAKPAAKRKPAAKAKEEAAAEDADPALESSILAAIAEAVDVLVDDEAEGGPAAEVEEAAAVVADAELDEELLVEEEAIVDEDVEFIDESEDEAELLEEAEEEAAEDPADDDIGDEIQRIIASYSKARKSQ